MTVGIANDVLQAFIAKAPSISMKGGRERLRAIARLKYFEYEQFIARLTWEPFIKLGLQIINLCMLFFKRKTRWKVIPLLWSILLYVMPAKLCHDLKLQEYNFIIHVDMAEHVLHLF